MTRAILKTFHQTSSNVAYTLTSPKDSFAVCLILVVQIGSMNQVVVAHALNPSNQETEAGRCV